MKKNLKKQNGSVVTILLCVVIGIIVIALGIVSTYFSYGRKGVIFEQGLRDTQEEGKGFLSKCEIEISQMAKIPKKYEEGFANLIKTDHEGRYGKDTTERVAMFMNERNLPYDSSFLKDLSNKIQSCETGFFNIQKLQQSKLGAYNIQLEDPWTGIFYRMHGFPKINLKDFSMVLDEKAVKQYETKIRQNYDTESK